MKKKSLILSIFLLTLCSVLLFAEEPPIASGGINDIGLYRIANSYSEQDGYALVDGRKLHYWLYDTVAAKNGDSSEIYNKFIPRWVESMGYVIDFDNIRVINNNTALANSVRALMKQRGANVSVTLCTKENSGATTDYVCINEYMSKSNTYKFTCYYLYK